MPRTLSVDVMWLARQGCLAESRSSILRWSYGDGSTASISLMGGRDAVTLTYCTKDDRMDLKTVTQQVPIHWAPCRFSGERPWFICEVHANGAYCGRRVAKLYSGGRLFACRHCYRLGYAVQRGGPMDQAHHNLARLHRKLGADYNGPDMPPPPKPKWMRWRTYSRIARQIEAGNDRLDMVFMAGALRILATIERTDQRRRSRQ